MLWCAQRGDRTVRLGGVGAVAHRVRPQMLGALGHSCGNFSGAVDLGAIEGR